MSVLSAQIISFYSTLNNGDRALLEVNISQITNAYNNPEIVISATWPYEAFYSSRRDITVIPSLWRFNKDFSGDRFILQLLNYLYQEILCNLYIAGNYHLIPPNYLKIFNLYRHSDLIASVSSTHFLTTGKYGWPLPIKTLMANLASRMKKPFVVLPQSIGPLRWDWERRLLAKTFNNANLVLLRDRASMRLADQLGLSNDKVKFAPDPAFAYPAENRKIGEKILERYSYSNTKKSIGVTLIPWQGRSITREAIAAYYKNLATFLDKFHHQIGAHVYLFNQVLGPTVFDDDRVAADQFLANYSQPPSWLSYVNEELTPGELKACYGLMDLFVATRLHSGIFSLGMNVPVIFVGYGTKTIGMMEWLGLQDYVVNINDVTEGKLLELASKAWANKEDYQHYLATKIPQIQQEVFDTSFLLRGYVS